MPRWITVLRHGVGIAVVSALLHYPVYGGVSISGSSLIDWGLKLLGALMAALLVAGAWALFFTARSKGMFWGNLVRSAWAIVLLISLGEWTSTQPSRPSSSASVSNQSEQSAAAVTIKRERKVDELRRLHSKLAHLSDAEMLRVVGQDYPDLPMERLAADLGLKVIRTD